MKKLLIVSCLLCIGVFTSTAQSLKEVDSTYFSNPGVSLLQNNIAFNGKLYMFFRGKDYKLILIELNGDQLIEIPNPTGFDAGGLAGYYLHPAIVVHNKLYMFYHDNSEKGVLVTYDGNALEPITTPQNHKQYAGEREVIENMLYTRFEHNDGYYSLMKYDGDTMTEIETPLEFRGSKNGLLSNIKAHNNTLYLRYRNKDGNFVLFTYDGDSLVEIPNPIGFDAPGKGFLGNFKIFKNDMYLTYHHNDGAIFVFKHDGDSLHMIDNPEGYKNRGLHLMLNKNDSLLMLKYVHDNQFSTLFVYNGQKLREIPNLPGYSGNNNGLYDTIGEYQGKNYFQYIANSGSYVMVAFDGNTLTSISNPTGFENFGYIHGGAILNGKMIVSYKDNDRLKPMFEFDGETLLPINSPPNFELENSGYQYSMKVFNNKLVMRFRQDDLANRVCIYDGIEIKELENPTTGYTDFFKGYTGENFTLNDRFFMRFANNDGTHQLFELDESTGLKELSSHINFIAYPNPTSDYVTISGLKNGDFVRLYDLTGRLVVENQAVITSFTLGLPQAKGVYFIEVARNGVIETKKLIKE